MSKTPYTVNVDEYICTALDYIRKMHETRDYSGLLAVVERIQIHANRMEAAIGEEFDQKYLVNRCVNDDDISDKDFREKVRKAMEK